MAKKKNNKAAAPSNAPEPAPVEEKAQATEEVEKEQIPPADTNAAVTSSPAKFDSPAGKALEEKLGKLKGQLTDLRSSIKVFEEEFEKRLDQCLQDITSATNAASPQKA